LLPFVGDVDSNHGSTDANGEVLQVHGPAAPEACAAACAAVAHAAARVTSTNRLQRRCRSRVRDCIRVNPINTSRSSP
jgi:hypothetical protein